MNDRLTKFEVAFLAAFVGLFGGVLVIYGLPHLLLGGSPLDAIYPGRAPLLIMLGLALVAALLRVRKTLR